MTIKNNNEKQTVSSSHRLQQAAGVLFLLIQFFLLTSCLQAPREPVLLSSKHFSSIDEENPATLSFQVTGVGPILVHVFGHEVEFESRIIDAQGSVLNEARLPYVRMGPVYQLLESDQATGQN